jgi:hypothetical protein
MSGYATCQTCGDVAARGFDNVFGHGIERRQLAVPMDDFLNVGGIVVILESANRGSSLGCKSPK